MADMLISNEGAAGPAYSSVNFSAREDGILELRYVGSSDLVILRRSSLALIKFLMENLDVPEPSLEKICTRCGGQMEETI